MHASTTLISLGRDHSGSMRPIAAAAARDYNANIRTVRAATQASGMPTKVSVFEIGYEHTILPRVIIHGQPVGALTEIPEYGYSTNGGTPLWDGIAMAIDELLEQPEAKDPTTAFMVMVTTDGKDEHSRIYDERSIQRKMDDLIGTDRWTFVFRVPASEKNRLLRMGIPEGNIFVWDRSAKSVQASQDASTAGLTQYFTDRAAGKTSTKRFFADLSSVSVKDVRQALDDVRGEITFLPVSQAEHEKAIRDFVEDRVGSNMLKGAAFYQLTKGELKVQDYKLMAVRNQKTGEVFASKDANEIRSALGLPHHSTKMSPADLGEWDLFIQSTSTNRKVIAGTDIMYWPSVGKRFKEGKSA